MAKVDRPRLKELRAVYRLIGECRELGLDANLWRLHMLHGLLRILGAKAGLCFNIHHPLDNRERITALLAAGLTDADHLLWSRYPQANAQRRDPFHQGYFRGLGGRLRTRRLDDVVDPDTWYRSCHYRDYVWPCGLGDRIATSLRLGAQSGSPIQTIMMHRDAAKGRFARRTVRLLHLFHHELGTSVGRYLILPCSSGENSAPLPPRLRQVLACLLQGNSEKQIAQRLGISPYTVNRHVQRLYRHFGVRSHRELVFHCRHLIGQLTQSQGKQRSGPPVLPAGSLELVGAHPEKTGC